MRIISKNKYFKIPNIIYSLDEEKISYIKLNVHTLKKGKNPILILKLDGHAEKNIDISTKISIAESKYSNVKIVLPENQKIETEIFEKIRTFLKDEEQFSQICTLFGPSGTGKSYIIKKIFSEDIFLGQNVIYLSFNYDQNSNVERLLNLMIRFYFHLWEGIDDIDTNNLHNNIPELLKEYVERYKQKRLTASELAEMANDQREICFSATHLNKRIIVIEDSHKLDKNLRGVLGKVIRDFVCSKTNILTLIVGQEDLSYLTIYPKVMFNSYELSLTQGSFLKCLDENGINYNKEYTLVAISDKLLLDDKINIFFIKDFISYIKSNCKANSEIDITDVLNQYIYSDKFKESVLENIKTTIFENGESSVLHDLLHIIYFSLSGINFSLLQKKHRGYIDKLIAYQLIRKDESNKLVPVHDIYCDLFRNEFDCHHNGLFNIYEGKLYSTDEKVRYLLSQNMINPLNLLNHIENLILHHQYYIVFYTLSVIFKDFQKPDTSLSVLRSKIGDKIQYENYKLFYFYIYSLGHNSHTFRVYNTMKQLEEHLHQNRKEFTSTDFMCLRADILGELINSAFETLEVDNVRRYSEDIIELFEQIKEDKPNYDYSRNGAYILMKEIGVLTDQFLYKNDLAAKEYATLLSHCEDIGFTVKCAIIRIRYARGLYASDLKQAQSILKEADNYLQECGDIKWRQIKNFEVSYVNILLREDSIDNLKNNLNKLKFNLYNDYRRGLRTICAYYLSVNRIGHFDIYFQEYLSSPRPMNERDKGLMHHLLSLKYFLLGEYAKSQREIEQQKVIFESAGRSYKSLIEHNLKMAIDSSFSPPQKAVVKFNVAECRLEGGIMYIESRLW